MSETIVCPDCQRRLLFPGGALDEIVRCPSCGAEFNAGTAARVAPPKTDAGGNFDPKTLPPPSWRNREREDRAAEQPSRTRPPLSLEDAPRSSQKWLIALALLILFVVFVGGIGFVSLVALKRYVQSHTIPPPAPLARRDDRQEKQDVKEAFKDQDPVALKELAPELEPLFEKLGAALRAGDKERIAALFDLERMVDEIVALLGHGRPPAETKRALEQSLVAALQGQSALLHWDKSEIRNIKRLSGTEIVVIARHEHSEGNHLKFRWYLTRRSGSWKVYDLEDLDMGMRLFALMAALFERQGGNLAETALASRTLRDALHAVVLQHNLDDAERKLQQIKNVPLPNPLEAFRYFVTGVVHLERGRFREALTALEKAQTFQPDMPILELLKGRTLNKLGRWQEGLPHLQAYRDLLGDDAIVCCDLGESLRGVRRFPEAATAYRKALDLNPKCADAFYGFLCSLGGEDNMDDLGPRFLKLGNLHDNFDFFAKDCVTRDFPALLEPLVQAMTTIDAEQTSVCFYTAWLKVKNGQADKAMPLFQVALKREKDGEKRKLYIDGFLKAMATQNKSLDAYAAVPDAEQAFRVLAAETMKSYRHDQLRELIAVHRKKFAADPLLPWYQAEVYVRDGQYALAEKTFTAAQAKPPDAATLQFRASRVLARYHSGQVLSAYRELGPREETFVQLATLLFDEGTEEQLLELLAAHVKNEPDSVEGLRFQCRLKLKQKEFPKGIALFKTILTKPVPAARRTQLVSEFLRDMADAGQVSKGYQAAPEAVEAFQLLAARLLMQNQVEDLRSLIEAHRSRHAADPWLAYYQGQLHIREQAWDKAAQMLKEAMKKAPADLRNRFRWQTVFALYKAGRGLEAYADLEPRETTFGQLANLLCNDGKGTELEALIKAHRPHAEDEAALLYYAALAKVFLKQPQEAIVLFRQAYQKENEKDVRHDYSTRFLREMNKIGQAMEAYRTAPNAAVALETLATLFTFQKKEKELAALLEEHAKAYPDEPLVEFYRGELLLLRGQAENAEPHFAAALAKSAPAQQWRFRRGWLRARVKAGRAAETYRDAEPKGKLFDELAYLCVEYKDAKQLQALLEVYRLTEPEPAILLSWELEVRWLSGNYEGALKLLTEHQEDVFTQARFQWKADDIRVRSLVKLKRTQDAIREAEVLLKARYGNQTLAVLAYAAAGEMKKAMAVLEKGKSAAYLLTSCYEDPDLGPLLRSEAFKEFRAKFPEPKQQETEPEEWDEP